MYSQGGLLPQYCKKKNTSVVPVSAVTCYILHLLHIIMLVYRDEFRPRQTRKLPRAVDLKGRLLSCQSY